MNLVGRGLAIGGVVALAACAGDDEPVADDSTATTAGAEAETTTTAADGVPDVAAEYLDLLGGGDLGGMDRAVEFAADGSPAELQAHYITAATRYAGPIVTARLVAAYATARGGLFVALDITNGGEGVAQVDDCGATYVGPDAARSTSRASRASHGCGPGATASVLYKIDQAPLGGVLSITAATDEREAGTFYDSAALDVPVPA